MGRFSRCIAPQAKRCFGTIAAVTVATTTLLSPVAAHAAYTFTGFGPGQWGVGDTTLGITGLTIEDFEDVNLAPGLQISATNSSLGTYGPTATLPQTFNPNTQDSFGNVFVGGNWDGANVLINTGTNRPGSYVTGEVWGNLTFAFTGAGVSRVGFSFEQSEALTGVLINGVNVGSLQTLAGLSTSSGRVGYVRIDATGGSAPIQTLTLTNNATGDGWAVDHLAFGGTVVPEPGTFALLALPLALAALRQYSRTRKETV